jgi:hypothetical protein
VAKKWILAMVLSMAMCGQVLAKECAPGRTMPLDMFMQQEFPVKIPLNIFVPKEYAHVRLEKQPTTYSYWMRPGEDKKANEDGQLPVDTGYLYGKMSTSAGYDIATNTFIGLDDIEDQVKAMGYVNVETTRVNRHGHELLFLQGLHKEKKQWLYTVYIAMNVDTVVFFVSYAAPKDRPAIGQCVWSQIRAALEGGSP